MSDIAAIRKEYMQATLDEHATGDNPFDFFKKWFLEAEQAHITEVNAMTLATVDNLYKPHARIVLLKGVDEDGFVFFTNYDSNKGQELQQQPCAALAFFWKELERQVRIEGNVEKVSPSESDAYFRSRPRMSRIGAWSSPQSRRIEGRHILELNFSRYDKAFSEIEVPRPAHWGGYKVLPQSIEFWQGRSSRMHDRLLFTKTNSGWEKCRLAP